MSAESQRVVARQLQQFRTSVAARRLQRPRCTSSSSSDHAAPPPTSPAARSPRPSPPPACADHPALRSARRTARRQAACFGCPACSRRRCPRRARTRTRCGGSSRARAPARARGSRRRPAASSPAQTAPKNVCASPPRKSSILRRVARRTGGPVGSLLSRMRSGLRSRRSCESSLSASLVRAEVLDQRPRATPRGFRHRRVC